MNLYLTRSGRLRRQDNTLSFEVFSPSDSPDYDLSNDFSSDELENEPVQNKNALPVENIDAVYVFSEMSLNSKLLNFLAQNKIPLHVFNYYGHHAGSFLPHAEQLSGILVIKQAEAFQNPEKRLLISKKILAASAHNIHAVMQYYARKNPKIIPFVQEVSAFQNELSECIDQDSLMGYEGSIRRIYYQAWHLWLAAADKNFKRVYRPADNPLNATVSFVNALLYTACVSELYRTALYPGISYIHQPQSRRYSLALDLVEPFKPLLADRMVFRLWNSNMISDRDFLPASNGFILTDDARRMIVSEWDNELKHTIFLDSLKRSVSYRQLLRLDCYKLVNFLLEDREYQPYRTRI